MLRTIFCCLLLALSPIASLADDTPFVVPIDKDGIQRVDVEAGEYFFKPRHIVVKVNIPVALKARNVDRWVPHDIVINAPEAGININEALEREEAKTYNFTPSKPGKYPLYCSKKLIFMKSHREKGMEGILEVVE